MDEDDEGSVDIVTDVGSCVLVEVDGDGVSSLIDEGAEACACCCCCCCWAMGAAAAAAAAPSLADAVAVGGACGSGKGGGASDLGCSAIALWQISEEAILPTAKIFEVRMRVKRHRRRRRYRASLCVGVGRYC